MVLCTVVVRILIVYPLVEGLAKIDLHPFPVLLAYLLNRVRAFSHDALSIDVSRINGLLP